MHADNFPEPGVGGRRQRVLLLCTGNSCRSQMAEGWARLLHGDTLDVVSAGHAPKEIDDVTILIMAEAGVDISEQRSKHVDDVSDPAPDYVLTLCDSAHERCPAWPGGVPTLHVGFEDPSAMLETAETPDEAIAVYRRVRDEIRELMERLPDVLGI